VPKEIITVCPYCGAGCQMVLTVEGNKIEKVSPFDKGDRYLCPKGLKVADFVHSPKRLLKPLVRGRNGFRECSWEEAVGIVVAKLSALKERYGADSIGFIGSGCFTNEEIYSYQKFVRAVIGTNNIDSCARICHIPSLKALMKSIGSATMSNTIGEIVDTKVIFIAGYNPTAAHPRLAYKSIKPAKQRGSKIIVMDPRRTPIAELADVFLQLRPGAEIPILNAMARIIIKEGLVDPGFISNRTVGYEELKHKVEPYTPEYAEKISGVAAESIIEAARLYATGDSSVVLWGMGMTQHVSGVENVSALVNLVLLTGNVGKPKSGFSPVRGQNNVQGASFLGALPDIFPGYKFVGDPAVRRKFEEFWGVDRLPEKVGATSTEVIPGVLNGKTRMLYIAGENPAISQANLNITRKALAAVEFLVVQDIFMTETAEYADVVLPACTFAEKEGTFFRLDRAVQLLSAAIPPRGESLPDWRIIQMIASGLGHADLFPYQSATEIWDEIRKVVPGLAGITHLRLQDGQGIHMPCPDESHPGTPVRYTATFPQPGGRARFVPVEFVPSAELTDAEYPFLLTTGRDPHHYNTATMTRQSPYFTKQVDRAYLEMHPEDAERYGLAAGDQVEVVSRRGKTTLVIRITDKVMRGMGFAPFHFGATPINLVTNDAFGPVSKTPEYKVCAVKLKKLL